MSLDVISVTVQVTNLFSTIGVPYFIGGSLASTLYGMVRTTQDADIIADLGTEHIPLFIDKLQNDFYIDGEMMTEAITQHSSFNIIHRESMIKVDVFIPQSRSFTDFQFFRAREEVLSLDPHMTARVASPEDILLAKLEWYRLGGEVSERQWRDVIGVLKVQTGMLELDYLHRMAQEIHVEDLLDKALAESE